MSNICDIKLPEIKDIGISSDMAIPMVFYKGQIMPMQPGMTIPSCFLPPAPPPVPVPPPQPQP